MVLIAGFIGILVQGLAVYGGQITLPPEDATVANGEWVQLKCEVDTTFMAWLYLTASGDLHMIFTSTDPDNYDKDVYEMEIDETQPNKKYYLAVKSLVWMNGGRYSCLELDSAQQANANLVVLDSLFLTLPVMQEGETVNITCEAVYGGPDINHLPESQIPKLASYKDGNLMSDVFTTIPGSPGTHYYLVRQEFQYDATSLDNGKPMTCVVSTSSPAYEIAITKEINVEFAVREIEIVGLPSNGVIEVGGHLNCRAKGNPPPEYAWTPISSNGARDVYGATLEIYEDMIGPNVWRCVAHNAAQGSEPITLTTDFTVVAATEKDESKGDTGTRKTIQQPIR